jgi:hypothetical protein
MAASQFYPERLDMPISAKNDHRRQLAKRLSETIVEANIDFKKNTRYPLPAQKKSFGWR